MAHYYPPPSFHFAVEFDFKSTKKIKPSLLSDQDTLFQSVSGLNAEFQTESIQEGGQNQFEHVIPTRTRYSDLVLKRGVLKDSGVIQWCRKAIERYEIEPINITVKLFGIQPPNNQSPNNQSQVQTLVTWNIYHAWPKKWSVSDLNAEQSELLVETIELAYNYFTVEHSAPYLKRTDYATGN